jgi:hypothetical protein
MGSPIEGIQQDQLCELHASSSRRRLELALTLGATDESLGRERRSSPSCNIKVLQHHIFGRFQCRDMFFSPRLPDAEPGSTGRLEFLENMRHPSLIILGAALPTALPCSVLAGGGHGAGIHGMDTVPGAPPRRLRRQSRPVRERPPPCRRRLCKGGLRRNGQAARSKNLSRRLTPSRVSFLSRWTCPGPPHRAGSARR